MLLVKKNKSIFFIHIPRTGGRYVKNLLYENGYSKEQFFHKNMLFLSKELVHLDKERASILYNTVINSFCVFRNPVDKFFSAAKNTLNIRDLNCFDFTEFSFFMDEKEIVSVQNHPLCNSKMISFGLVNVFNNWFLPQHKFLFPDTKLWKFENGFDSNFIEWINDSFNLNIKKYEIVVKSQHYDLTSNLKLSSKLEENISRYYLKDLEIWNNI